MACGRGPAATMRATAGIVANAANDQRIRPIYETVVGAEIAAIEPCARHSPLLGSRPTSSLD